MKRVIDNLYTLKGAKSGTRIAELKLQLGMGTDTPTTDYVKHSLATAANDFLVASGSGAFAKQTLAQTKTTLGLGTAAYTAATAYVTHALATAANDFIVASGTGTFVKKTLAETKVILGLGSAAYVEAVAANDFIVATGVGAFVKKTLEQTRAILGKLYEAQEDISSGESETTLSLDSFLSLISTDSAGDVFILPNGTVTGQLKKILMKADGGDSVGDGEGDVTGMFGSDAGTLKFNNAGEYALLQWDGTQWNCLELGSMFDTTNAPTLGS